MSQTEQNEEAARKGRKLENKRHTCLRDVLSKDERNNREENPTTYQKTELRFIIDECQKLHPADEPLPVGWQSNISLTSLHHIILQTTKF